MVFLGISVLAYALNNVLWKYMLSKLSPAILIVTRSFFTTLIAIALGLALVPNIFDISSADYFSSMTASISGALGLICMISALKEGALKFLALYNLLTVFIMASYLFIFEDLPVLTYGFGAVLMLFGYLLFLFSSDKSQLKSNFLTHLKFLFMAIFFFVSGLLHWYNLLKEVHPTFVAANQEVVVFIFGLFYMKVRAENWNSIRKSLNFNHLKLVFLMALVIFIAVYFGLLGMRDENPLLFSLASLSVPVLTFFFGILFFKEKINIQSIIALTAMVTAAFLLL